MLALDKVCHKRTRRIAKAFIISRTQLIERLVLLTKPKKEISGIDHKPEWIDQVLVMTSPLFISMHVIGPTLLQVNEIVGLQLLTPLGFGLIRPTLT